MVAQTRTLAAAGNEDAAKRELLLSVIGDNFDGLKGGFGELS